MGRLSYLTHNELALAKACSFIANGAHTLVAQVSKLFVIGVAIRSGADYDFVVHVTLALAVISFLGAIRREYTTPLCIEAIAARQHVVLVECGRRDCTTGKCYQEHRRD